MTSALMWVPRLASTQSGSQERLVIIVKWDWSRCHDESVTHYIICKQNLTWDLRLFTSCFQLLLLSFVLKRSQHFLPLNAFFLLMLLLFPFFSWIFFVKYGSLNLHLLLHFLLRKVTQVSSLCSLYFLTKTLLVRSCESQARMETWPADLGWLWAVQIYQYWGCTVLYITLSSARDLLINTNEFTLW